MSKHAVLTRAHGTVAFAISFSWALALAVLLSPGRAEAEEAAGDRAFMPLPRQPRATSPAASKPVTVTHWYGYQTLAIDFAVLALLGAPPAAVATYFLGAPVVHFMHGNVGRGFGSLGLRLVAVVPLMVAASCTENVDPEPDSGGGECLGVVVGGALLALLMIPAAITIDAAALAWEKKVVSPGQALRWSLTPYYKRHTGTAGVHVVARF